MSKPMPATVDAAAAPPVRAVRVPAAVWAGLTLAVALDVPVQLLWKALMLKYASPLRGPVHGLDSAALLHQARWFLHQTRTWAMLALFVGQFFNWIWVLGNADLSYAQPFTALAYVLVSGCAAIFFHEHVSPLRMAGIGLILGGVLLVGSSPHRTTLAGAAEVHS